MNEHASVPNSLYPRTADAEAFLRQIAPDGPWNLTWLDQDAPKGKVREETVTFSSNKWEQMLKWIEHHNSAPHKRNIYFMPNPAKSAITKKASKDEISEACWLWLDVDPRPWEDLTEERDRIRLKLSEFMPTPTFIIDSGGGYQALFQLASPLPTDGADGPLTLDAERRGYALENRFGEAADACRDICRVLRLPGTVNWPNEKKRKRGRQPALASVYAYNAQAIHAADAFPPDMRWMGSVQADTKSVLENIPELLPRVDVRKMDCLRQRGEVVHNRVVAIVENTFTPEYNFGGNRSAAVLYVACELARSNATDEEIVSILVDPAYKVSEHVREQKKTREYAARQVARAREMVEKEAVQASPGTPVWADVSEKLHPKSTFANTMIAIQALGITCEHDVFHERLVVGGYVIANHSGELTDHACSMLRALIRQKFGFDPNKENTRDAALQLCIANRRDPITEYLDSLQWDGVPRLEQWLTIFLGAKDTPLHRGIGPLILAAAVRRARRPGYKFDFVPIFEGTQGSGKSSAVEILAGSENFSDEELLTLNARERQEAVQGVWIFEIAELSGMRRVDVNKVKAFASRTWDRARPAYGRFRHNQPRRCIFIGTTNDSEYLQDQTGNRRFWPVKTGKVDLNALRRDRDQLWAEAAVFESKKEGLSLPTELWGAAAEQQAARMVHDPWQDILVGVRGELHDKQERIAVRDLLSHHLGMPNERWTDATTKRLAAAMRALGWEGTKVMRFSQYGSKPLRGFFRALSDDEPVPDPNDNIPF